jgi:multidrug efflux pump subunit AcrA (membrane-fusion protein)
MPRPQAIQRASVQAREAAAESAKAQLEQAKLNLSYTKIYAPVAGIVGQKPLEIGQRLEIGHNAAGRYLGYGEFQGDAVEENAARSAGRYHRRRVWEKVPRVCGEHAGGHRSGQQSAAARECHGELCESGTAIAGAYPIAAG